MHMMNEIAGPSEGTVSLAALFYGRIGGKNCGGGGENALDTSETKEALPCANAVP